MPMSSPKMTRMFGRCIAAGAAACCAAAADVMKSTRTRVAYNAAAGFKPEAWSFSNC